MFFRKKFRWCRLFIWIGGLIFLVLVMAIAARLWLIPIAIKSEIESKIRRVWSGPVFVGPVRFTYDGHVQLEQITLQDSNERQRLQAESIHIVLEKWPTELKTISLDIDSLRIQVFLDNDSHFPKTSQSKSKLEKPKVGYSGIEKLKIKNISAAFYDSKGTRVGYEDLNLSANRADGLYHIKLERVSENRPESFLLNGTFSPESRLCSLELDAHHRCTFDETAMLAKLLNLNSFYKAEGTIIADIDIKGDLRRLNYLSNNGNIKIKDVNVMRKEVLIFENMSSDIELGNRLYDVTNIQADFCEGSLQGTLTIDHNIPESSLYLGEVSLKSISLAELTKRFETSRKFQRGTVSAQYYFKGNERDFRTLQGDGTIFIDNADLQTLPVIPYIFASIGLKEYDPLRVTDLAAVFSNSGSLVTLHKAQIANKLSAVRAEPGGKIDLKNKQVDMYIVAAALKQIDDVVKDIPLVNLFARLKDKLVRLKVQGNWSGPPGKLITKEPLTDVKEGTISFLKDVSQSGGQITQQMYDSVKTFLSRRKNLE